MLGVEEAQEVFPLWLSHPLALGKKGPDLQTQPLSRRGVSRQKERSGVPLLLPSEVGVQPMS